MSKVETYQLCHPELLSEVTLRELLANNCIVLPMLENLNKNELVEIFKRIAMPLPQRRYNASRNLGKKLNDLRVKRGIDVATCNGDADSSSITDSLNPDPNPVTNSRLKPPIAETEEVSKKIRLSDECHDDTIENNRKRQNEVSSISKSKKRQKITWP